MHLSIFSVKNDACIVIHFVTRLHKRIPLRLLSIDRNGLKNVLSTVSMTMSFIYIIGVHDSSISLIKFAFICLLMDAQKKYRLLSKFSGNAFSF